MANKIEVYPTCDVHLLTGTSMQLTVRDSNNLDDVSNDSRTSYLDFDSSIVTVSHGNITAAGSGETIGRIRHTDGSAVSEVLIRIRVHNDIQDLWIGNNRATVNEGSDNYVLTVYAKFDDDTLGDVSYHPYLNWNSSDSGNVSVNGEGRITGNTNGTNASITVSYNSLSDTVTTFVKPPYTSTRQILEPIHESGDFSKRKNILILGEGFKSGEKALFEQLAQKVKHNLLDTNSQSPYDVLKKDFNIWTAFEGTEEDGVTIGNPVRANGKPVPHSRAGGICNPSNEYTFKELVALVGLPDSSSPGSLSEAKTKWGSEVGGFDETRLTDTIFQAWKEQEIHGYTQARDSLLGMCLGRRFGDRDASRNISAPLSSWYLPAGPPRRISPDRKRMYLNWDYDQPLQEYISSLRIKGIPISDSKNNVVGSWLSGGVDESLVCILAKDDYRCGTNFEQLAQTIGRARKHNISTSGNKVDHSPLIGMAGVNVAALSSTVAHEFAHSMDLGDEYEGYDSPSHRKLDLSNTDAKRNISEDTNLTHYDNVKGSGPDEIDATKIKWNWPRINKLSTIEGSAQNQSGNKIKVTLRSGEAAGWSKIQTDGTEVYLRNPDINKNRHDSDFYELGPLTINSISGDDIILDGGQISPPDSLPDGSHLYEPLKNEGTILKVIDEKVLTHLQSTKRPFGEKSDCARCTFGPAYPDNNISGFNYPRYRYETVGIYEGGGTYNCDVFRSNGAGKMRYSHTFDVEDFVFDPDIKLFTLQEVERQSAFSFVSKYIIVNKINAEKLPDINALYPKP